MSRQVLSESDALQSRGEVAQRVGCHPRTVARAEKRGELTAIKFNARLVRYRRSEIEAWISKAECIRYLHGIQTEQSDKKGGAE